MVGEWLLQRFGPRDGKELGHSSCGTKENWAALTVESIRGTRCKELGLAGVVEKLSQSHPSQSQTSRQVPQKAEAISG